MPQMQLRLDAAAALGRAVAAAWGGRAALEPEDDAPGGAGAAAPAEPQDEPGAAVQVGGGIVWLAGDLAPGLGEAAAQALGGDLLDAVPDLDPGAVGIPFRWSRAGSSGRSTLWATPDVWAALDDGAGGGEPDGAGPADGSAPVEAAGPAGPPAGGQAEAPFPLLADRRGSAADQSIDLLLDVPLAVTVELGRTEKVIREILALRAGAIIELDRLAGEPVDVLVNGKPIARGEVVVIDENFGVRITDILSQAERLGGLA